MKHVMNGAVVTAALTAALLLLPGFASAGSIEPGNYLRYSYRDHYRAYGINSLFDGTLPPDQYYVDPCYRWVQTPRGLRRKFVCRP
jgi:hypothetical protein